MECKSCGNDHQENFCPACGEKEFKDNQLSVKHFVEESFESFIHFDSKFFRTLKTLVARPGQLSLDHTQGRRVRYMRPIQFFLIVNLLFFVLLVGNTIYSLRLFNYVTYRPFIEYNTKKIVQDKLVKSKLSMEEFQSQFDEKVKADSKEFIFLFIPFYGLLFFLLLFWKKKYFVEHLIFATHFMAFVLLAVFAEHFLMDVPFYLISKINYSEIYDAVAGIVLLISIATYLAFAVHRYYRPHIIWTLLVSLIIGGTFMMFIQYYRMLLFFKIMYLG